MNIFEEIYEKDIWGFGSGHGSLPSVTKGYAAFLKMFMDKNQIESVVDYGCGDWQFSRYIDWTGIKYLGLETVSSLVKTNSETYAKKNIKFEKSPAKLSNIPKADLLLVKDVLQHISSKEIHEFIELVLPLYKFALITNNFIPKEIQNKEIKTGEFRPLDLRRRPFSLNAAAVYSFGRNRRTYSLKHRQYFDAWEEVVLLIDNTQKPGAR